MKGSVFYYETELGTIGIAEADGNVTHLFFRGEKFPGNKYEMKETPILAEAAKQLAEYLCGTRREFNLPLAPSGTEFMRRVWKALLEIPYGETRSYKEIAAAAGSSKACRAVGMANNPESHRHCHPLPPRHRRGRRSHRLWRRPGQKELPA
jgi:methylated-DNA-[protein]-cysteine S-methyltransferase